LLLLAATATPRSASPFPFYPALRPMRHRPNTPLSIELELESEQSSSPFIESPAHLPLHYLDNSSNNSKVQSQNHHHCQVGTIEENHEEQDEWTNENHGGAGDQEQVREEVALVVPPKDKKYKVRKIREFYLQPRLVKSASDIEFEAQLLPVDDPLLEDDIFLDSSEDSGISVTLKDEGEAAEEGIEEEEEDGWETESETKYSDDSFDSNAYDSDDDDDEIQNRKLLHAAFGAVDRFIDSGWGGECLREVEDIDFEFVYALHTFVATVEGQANAQKGDTMVLLDDSNSYWWLVRVVKDSTIGQWLGFA
jgi:hypothetical protein